MKNSAKQSLAFSSSSLLMGFLFAYSASVQLNDPDWYFWFPLYTIASGVNLLNISFSSKAINKGAQLALLGGLLLLLKVVIEAQMYGLSGIWSLDMTERVVREKIGSALVVASMFLHLNTREASNIEPNKRKRKASAKFIEHGMMMLAALSFGLSLYYLAFIGDKIKLK